MNDIAYRMRQNSSSHCKLSTYLSCVYPSLLLLLLIYHTRFKLAVVVCCHEHFRFDDGCVDVHPLRLAHACICSMHTFKSSACWRYKRAFIVLLHNLWVNITCMSLLLLQHSRERERAMRMRAALMCSYENWSNRIEDSCINRNSGCLQYSVQCVGLVRKFCRALHSAVTVYRITAHLTFNFMLQRKG